MNLRLHKRLDPFLHFLTLPFSLVLDNLPLGYKLEAGVPLNLKHPQHLVDLVDIDLR